MFHPIPLNTVLSLDPYSIFSELCQKLNLSSAIQETVIPLR